MEPRLVFLPLLLVLLLAFTVPILLTKLRWMPVIVGEILAGIIVGRSGLRLIQPDVTLDFLAEIGLAVLMFLSGLEVDFSMLSRPSRPGRSSRLRIFLVSSLSFLGTLGLAWMIVRVFVRHGLSWDPWMTTLILSTTSLGVVVPILKERGLTTSAYGQTILLSALAADFLTMFLITIYVAVRAHGVTLRILVVGVLFVIALLAYRIGLARIRKSPLRGLMKDLSASASHLRVHGSIAILMAFVILAAFLGTEMILGAFLAGAVLSLLGVSGDEPTRRGLEAIGFGFLIPLFFITVGIKFDLRSLISDPRTLGIVLFILLAALAIKLVPSLLFRLVCSWRETISAGILLSARLSLIIAAAGIGLELGLIDEAANASFILIAAFTSTFAPIAFHALIPPAAPSKKHPVIIYDAGDLSLQVARELVRRGEKPYILDSDAAQIKKAQEGGFSGLALRPGEPWPRHISPNRVRSFLALTSDDERNLAAGREALLAGVGQVISTVNDPGRLKEYQEAGIKAFVPNMVRAAILALMAENPAFFPLLMSGTEGYLIREVVFENPKYAERPLMDLPLGGEVLLLSLARGGEILIPHGRTVLQAGDRLTLLGRAEILEETASLLEGPDRLAGKRREGIH